MSAKAKIFISVLTAITLWGCHGGGNSNPVPKPDGWPRIETPDAEYSEQNLDGTVVRLNKSASITIRPANDGVWADIVYPQFHGATIYLSLIETDNLDEAIANRHQRMELNTHGATTELTQLVSDGGWTTEMAVTRSSTTTPVQIIAHDNHSRLLTGALYLNLPPESSADSISPIVNTVSRDLSEALRYLRKADN